MKKKGILFLVICLVLAFATLFTACSLVKVNEERQANHVVATVTVDLASKDEFGDQVKVLGDEYSYVVSLDITRRELINWTNYAINQYTQLYSQYGLTYDYDVESLLESTLKTLKMKKYNTIRAMGYLLANSKTTRRYDALYCRTNEYKAIKENKKDGKYILTPEGVLTQAERYTIISEVNDDFQNRLDGYLEESEENEEDAEKSDMEKRLSDLYADGYFVSSVAIGRKNGNRYENGLYKEIVVDDNDGDTEDLDYTKVFAMVTLFKEGAKNETIEMPIEATNLTLEAVANVDNPKYVTAKTATITFAGRVAASDADDEDGYDVETFTSAAEAYTLYSAKTAPTKSEEEEGEDDKLETLRYATGDALNEIKCDFFNANLGTYNTTAEKDAYRRLRDYFTSAKVGYTTEADTYNGLGYYYLSEFESHILEVAEFEIGEEVTEDSIADAEIEAEYNYLVEKDKINYENLTEEEQVVKFFDTLKGGNKLNGLENIYYVPIEALCNTTFEISADDKAYAVLFEGGKLTADGEKYATKAEDGKFYMPYAYKNKDEDGNVSYTINMFFTTHVLISLDNDAQISKRFDEVTELLSDEKKIEFVQEFIKEIKTAPQLADFLDTYAKAEEDETVADITLDQLYALNEEDGSLVKENYDQIIASIKKAIKDAEDNKEVKVLDAFIKLTEQYNDDNNDGTGKLENAGYVVSAGEMQNNWAKDFTATALQIYFTKLLAGEEEPTGYLADANGYAESNYAYSNFGIHFMYLTFAPLYQVKIDANGGIGLDTPINLDGDTRKSLIQKDLMATKEDSKYDEWVALATDERVDNNTNVDSKYYKKIIKDVKD